MPQKNTVHQFSLFTIAVLYKVMVNTEIVNTKPLFLRIIQNEVLVNLWIHFH